MSDNVAVTVDDLGLRPLSARSVVLSLLLGAHPPELPARDLVLAADVLGISEATLRVALTRMAAAGDLTRTGTVYRLSDRLIERQRRQDEAIHPSTRPWHGDWEMAVVTAVGRPAADRADLRATLSALRLAELREGVWTRPANLRRAWPTELDSLVTRFTSRLEGEPGTLVDALWNLPAWADRARALHDHFHTTTDDPARRITAAAAIVRHLLADPVLPEAMRPADWPADTLRTAYATYQSELIHLANLTWHAS
ncbi:PaaX family transcriptional regulator C-terminal domain-containing protein [Actinokineospora sp.]|uniref:PaaX family transcriptional regulator C-terminal domain-containing protein n=1 Tax=Actinokineospora sp. TaxID=1872133 RepID=UPI003D6A2057